MLRAEGFRNIVGQSESKGFFGQRAFGRDRMPVRMIVLRDPEPTVSEKDLKPLSLKLQTRES